MRLGLPPSAHRQNVALHEGGFALWPSKHTNYSVLASPVPRDIVQAFVASCHRHGIEPCFYMSPVENGHAMRLPSPPN
eukprot:gene2040-4239_t